MGLFRRDGSMKEHRNLRLQGEETCPSWLSVQQTSPSLLP